jgi:GNAT superfamily N-acetyltransferase
VALRELESGDVEPVNRMLLGAFPATAPYGPRLREFHASGIAYTLIAETARSIGGMGTLLDYGTSGYIAHVGVDPACQGRGFGRQLMEGLLAESRKRGHAYVELQSTDAGYPLYLSLGFVVQAQTFSFAGGRAAADGAGVVAAAADDCAAVAALDAFAFGADRTGTVAQWFADPAATLLVHRVEGAVAGFVASRRGRIGPWLATNERSAELVLDALLTRRTEPMPVFGPAHAASRRILARREFTPRHRHRHMVYGAQEAVPDRPHVYGLITLSQG